ncbi:hypothetical protein QQ020_07755 [Fulvivirgaceae bacterium BMA12]|uniref:Lipoprotein n=1 Tax=Agaribacillus aureus TaxID=3051825 RepID=A0ABT8L673_9BACT|nr:hypothetical protein [Fulvivirgaceae bacterium BMA12]
MKSVITILISPLFLLLLGCGEDDATCNSGKIIAQATEESATLHFHAKHNIYYVNYFVKGTIDTFYKGFICTNAFPDFEFTEGMPVIFSGNFRETDLYNNNDFEVVIGGQEVYVLELQMLAAE